MTIVSTATQHVGEREIIRGSWGRPQMPGVVTRCEILTILIILKLGRCLPYILLQTGLHGGTATKQIRTGRGIHLCLKRKNINFKNRTLCHSWKKKMQSTKTSSRGTLMTPTSKMNMIVLTFKTIMSFTTLQSQPATAENL